MVDTEIFSIRLDALDGYPDRLRSLGEATEKEYLAPLQGRTQACSP